MLWYKVFIYKNIRRIWHIHQNLPNGLQLYIYYNDQNESISSNKLCIKVFCKDISPLKIIVFFKRISMLMFFHKKFQKFDFKDYLKNYPQKEWLWNHIKKERLGKVISWSIKHEKYTFDKTQTMFIENTSIRFSQK